MKKKWCGLNSCEKKVAIVCGVLAAACFVAAKVMEVQRNGK